MKIFDLESNSQIPHLTHQLRPYHTGFGHDANVVYPGTSDGTCSYFNENEGKVLNRMNNGRRPRTSGEPADPLSTALRFQDSEQADTAIETLENYLVPTRLILLVPPLLEHLVDKIDRNIDKNSKINWTK